MLFQTIFERAVSGAVKWKRGNAPKGSQSFRQSLPKQEVRRQKYAARSLAFIMYGLVTLSDLLPCGCAHERYSYG